jgi:hypothetical protein
VTTGPTRPRPELRSLPEMIREEWRSVAGLCNLHKGPNIAGLDPATGELTRLYNPRRDRHTEHFAWLGAVIAGLTPVGRTAVHVLAMNDPYMVAGREALMKEGRFPYR